MEENKKNMVQWPREAFLVCDRALKTLHSPFLDWLHSEGFTFGGYKGNFGCCWLYINISRKQYAYGMPGVPLTSPLGNHAITTREFRVIYDIYKQYEGKDCFVFHSERFDFDE